MNGRAKRLLGMTLLLVSAGCTNTVTSRSAANDEGPVRETFAAFQAALTARDAEQLWALLDSDSRADAERAAKTIQAMYAKASAEDKADQEKALGLPGAELAGLTGQGFLKTKRFHGKYDEVSDSKIDKITVQGDSATVAYTEADGDREKLTLVRQAGQWKVSAPMPKAK
jgi:hypothetical protein